MVTLGGGMLWLPKTDAEGEGLFVPASLNVTKGTPCPYSTFCPNVTA